MKLWGLVVILGLLCSVCPKPQVCYITPTSNLGSGNCTVSDNRTLTPCFSLRDLIYEEELLSSVRPIELLFLSGSHVIPENRTLRFFLHELEIRPWVEHLKPTIKCRSQAGLEFHVNKKVNVFSMHFTGCTLEYSQSVGIFFNTTNLVQIAHCGFQNSKQNYAIIIRGALDISLYRSEMNVNISFCTFFVNNGAIQARNPNIVTPLRGDNLYINVRISDSVFQSNYRDGEDGGALHVQRVDLKVIRSKFINNKARKGGAISSGYFLSLLTDTNVLSQWFPSIQISGCQFVNNSAVVGGAIFLSGPFSLKSPPIPPAVHLVAESIFQDNQAQEFGGAVHTLNKAVHFSNTHFNNNSASSGGALYILGKLSLDFIIANCSFVLNKAQIDGGGIHCETYNSHSNNIIFLKNYYLIINEGHSTSNSAGHGSGGFVYLSRCQTRICSHNISAGRALRGGAMYTVESNIQFCLQMELVNNSAELYGGALCLTDNSHVTFVTFGTGNHAVVTFNHNVVTSQDGVGGAIYVTIDNCELIPYPHFRCFVNSDYFGRFIFLNNTARQGSMIYGGLLDRCFMDYNLKKPRHLGIESIKNISQYEDTPLAIASEPVRLCLCGHDNKPHCDLREIRFTRMRGQSIDFVGIAVDQDGNPMAAVVRAGYNESSAELDKGEVRRRVSSRCNELSYHVFTTAAMATLVLQLEGSCERSQFSSLIMHIEVIPCSRGFETKNDRCVCERRLSNFFNITECDIDTNSIKRKALIWLR